MKFIFFVICCISLGVQASEGEVHWGYQGKNGPQSWGSLKEEWAVCKEGKEQSPINLKFGAPQKGGTLAFKYKESKVNVVNNGHTIQVNFEDQSSLDLRGEEFELLQMHFHSPSEHSLSGKSYPLELHLVHKNKDGGLGVLGVFFKTGSANKLIERIWKAIPDKLGEQGQMEGTLNPLDLIPKIQHYYQYSGSLTTPPCSEGVNWNVLNTPMTLSEKQLLQFRKLFINNARPLQELGRRKTTNY